MGSASSLLARIKVIVVRDDLTDKEKLDTIRIWLEAEDEVGKQNALPPPYQNHDSQHTRHTRHF